MNLGVAWPRAGWGSIWCDHGQSHPVNSSRKPYCLWEVTSGGGGKLRGFSFSSPTFLFLSIQILYVEIVSNFHFYSSLLLKINV